MPLVTVKHKKTGERYVYLGTGYGAWQVSKTGGFAPTKEDSDLPAVAVVDADGDILWFHSSELRVATVDGVAPREVFEMMDEVDS